MRKKNIAIILAAGSGERSGFDTPKQLVKLAGKPIIEHTISTFQNSAHIHEIIIVVSANCITKIEEIVRDRAFTKVKKIIYGGKERYESSMAAIIAAEQDSEQFDVKLIFHDAVRPLVNDRIIRDVVFALDQYNAVDVAVPTTDTVISADLITNTINSVPERKKLRNSQTPQGFIYNTIKLAYEIALKDPDFKTTDDCGVVFRYLPNEKIYLVNGESNNIKLTYKEDLQIIEKLLKLHLGKVIWPDVNSRTLSRLKNKIIVIVGSANGIAADMAEIGGAYQAKVVVANRGTGTDISDIGSLHTKFKNIHSEYGRIDYVVNVPGIVTQNPLTLMNYPDVLEAIQNNYLGTVNISIAAHKYLQESHGHLLNLTSGFNSQGGTYYSLDSSSNAAIINLTQGLAEEWATQQVRVNCVDPERTETPTRVARFGIEPSATFLSAKDIALFSLGVLLTKLTGQVYGITAKEVRNVIRDEAFMEESTEFFEKTTNNVNR